MSAVLPFRSQARTDALASARVRLLDELSALQVCEALGLATEAAVCRREIAYYRALVARLEVQS